MVWEESIILLPHKVRITLDTARIPLSSLYNPYITPI